MKKNHHGGKTLKVYEMPNKGRKAANYIDSISEDTVIVSLYEDEDEPGWYSLLHESDDSSLDLRVGDYLRSTKKLDEFESLIATKRDAIQQAKWWAQWMVEEGLCVQSEAYDGVLRRPIGGFVAKFYVKAEKA